MTTKVIYKYPVPVGTRGVRMGKNAKVLQVGSIYPDMVFWVEHEMNDEIVTRDIYGVMTGDTIMPNQTYHGTAIVDGIVVHVYEGAQP